MKNILMIPVLMGLFIASITSCNDDSEPSQPVSDIYLEVGLVKIHDAVVAGVLEVAATPSLTDEFNFLLKEVADGDLSSFNYLVELLKEYVINDGKIPSSNFKNLVEMHDPSVNDRMQGSITKDNFDAFVNAMKQGAQSTSMTSAQVEKYIAIFQADEDALVP